jgi:hypothetical protein
VAAPIELRLHESRLLHLSNTACAYCGEPLSKRKRTLEHVIGRRFVPLGALAHSWNLALWACKTCNQVKAELEDDVSAIAMAFHIAGLHGMSDARLQSEARRRSARSISRKTGKPVGRSAESLSIEVPLPGGAVLTGSFSAPPQFDEARTTELARLQLVGFFYMLTYNTQTSRGHWWPGGFFALHGTVKSDWGHPTQRAFMATVSTWDYRLIATTAQGYYRVAIRKHPSADCWSWAVEWNDCYRLVGFFGDMQATHALAAVMQAGSSSTAVESPAEQTRYRIEKPLPAEDDLLFAATTET